MLRRSPRRPGRRNNVYSSSDLRLTDLLWRGWRNHHLRALSQGQYVSLVVARRVSESVLASQLLNAVRDQKWGLDEIDNELARFIPTKLH